MGIDPGDVELLGQLDDMPTITNFLISTFVATIPCPYDFQPSEIEVAEVLEVPISPPAKSAELEGRNPFSPGRATGLAVVCLPGTRHLWSNREGPGKLPRGSWGRAAIRRLRGEQRDVYA